MDYASLERAKAYPYAIPAGSYVLAGGEHTVIPPGEALPDLAGRRPVLASGSNQSPERLKTKFTGDWPPLPVTRVRILDFDSVYSAHFSRYGSVPATIQHAPGTAAILFVNWLTPAQEARLHETESIGFNYDFVRLDGVAVHLDDGTALDRIYAYVSRRGCVMHDGAPVALARVPAEGRRWPALDQGEMLELVRRRLAPEADLAEFIGATIADEATRTRRGEALRADAQPFAYPGASHVLP